MPDIDIGGNIDWATLKDANTTQLDSMLAHGIDRVSLMDRLLIFLDLMLTGVSTATLKDQVTIFLDIIFLGKSDKATVRDQPNVYLWDGINHLCSSKGSPFYSKGSPFFS